MSDDATALRQWENEEEEERATWTARSTTLWIVGVISASWTFAVALAVIVHHAAAEVDDVNNDDNNFALVVLFSSLNQLLQWTLQPKDLVMNLSIDQVVSPDRRIQTNFIAGFGALLLFLHLPPAAAVALLLPGFVFQIAVVVMAGVAIYYRFTAN